MESVGVDDPAPAPAPKAKEKKEEASADDPEDETAVQAKAYCEHEVEKSQTSPEASLDKKSINACLVALRPAIKKDCDKGVKKELILKIVVSKDGAVTSAFAIGDGADSVEATCVGELVKEVTFPSFSDKETQIIEKYPFTIGQ